MSKTYVFHSPEMHCGACELIVERTLRAERHVRMVKADAAHSTVRVEGDFDESPGEIATHFSRLLEPTGYTIALPATSEKPRPAEK